jgi:hypothetical protein
MKSVAEIGHRIEVEVVERSFVLDTTFVLFFLAVELGRTVSVASLDSMLLGVALAGIAVGPYFFDDLEKPDFGTWLAGRGWLAAFGVGIGVVFNQLVGIVFPEMMRFAPMGLLIVSAIISCQVQFYRFLRVKQ